MQHYTVFRAFCCIYIQKCTKEEGGLRMKHKQKVYLVLEDASVYSGNSFGAPAPLPGDLEKNDRRA